MSSECSKIAEARRSRAWADPIPKDREELVLVFAPSAGDARITSDVLGRSGIKTEVLRDATSLCEQMSEGCGALLIAEEVLNARSATLLFAHLGTQPAWSEVPIILITSAGAEGAQRMRELRSRGFDVSATVLERPFRPGTFTSTVEAALRSRRRQYQVRRLLADLSAARDAAEQASKAKDDFLAALSHELRTPLNPVLLLAGEGAANIELPEAVRDDFRQIARNVELEARLIDDLLDITRVSRGKLTLSVQAIDLHDVLRETIRTTEVEFVAKQIRLIPGFAAQKTIVQADPVRVQQVFWNVLKNAAKFTPDGGEVRVSTRDDGTQITVEVTDTGVGMLPHELDFVFAAFAQGQHADPENRNRFGGLGLGLAISRQLVDMHGGRIVASSDGKDRGSTFTVTLPLSATQGSQAPFVPLASAPMAATLAGSKRLLLVEDHTATRKSLAHILRRRGFRVALAQSVSEARAILNSETIDLLISDIGLPDGTGLQLMAEFRHLPHLRGIAMSGFGTEADIMRSRQEGFSLHLTKPVSIYALDTALLSLLSDAGAPAGSERPTLSN